MYKLSLFLLFIVLINPFKVIAQIGINITDPTAMLDVNGTTIIDEKLFLENPGNSNQIRGSKLIHDLGYQIIILK